MWKSGGTPIIQARSNVPSDADRIDRRKFVVASVRGVAACGLVTGASSTAAQSAPPLPERTKEQWLDIVMGKKSLAGPLHLSRFVERIYILTKPIAWLPNSGQPYKRVDVPPGFVTDFASIPRPFWSLLPPDGEYVYAAILHDYLYWQQERPREESDDIFKFAMEDLKVGSMTIGTIHSAVRLGGGSAWDSNKQARIAGEKRLLKVDKLPNDPTTRWEEFRRRQDVFAE
jgi:hypothetical protein